jgi:hypothetical protein
VRAVVRPSGIGEGQLAASAFDSWVKATDRQIAVAPMIEVFKKLQDITSPVGFALEHRDDRPVGVAPTFRL